MQRLYGICYLLIIIQRYSIKHPFGFASRFLDYLELGLSALIQGKQTENR
jgi:hypothetical protein